MHPASHPSSIQHPASSIQQPANQHPASSNQPASQPTSHPTTSQPNPTQAVNPLGEGECFFIIFFLKNTPSRRDFFAFQKPRAFTYKMRVFFPPVFTFKSRFFAKNRRFVYAKWGGRKTAIVLPCVYDVFDGPKSESSWKYNGFDRFFFVKFRPFYLSQTHFCRFFGILEAKKRSKTCKFTVRADIHVPFVLCFTVFCENQDEKNSRKRVIYGTCT